MCIRDSPSSVPAWIRDAAAVLKGHVGGYTMVSSVSAYADNATPGQDETAPLATFDGDPLKETAPGLRADLAPGHVYALTGPSGSGKSTLLGLSLIHI